MLKRPNEDSVMKEASPKHTKHEFDEDMSEDSANENIHVLAQFKSEKGESAGPPIDLPLSLPKEKLQLILNTLLKQDESTPYSFFVEDKEILSTLDEAIGSQGPNEEKVLSILYQPQAVFRVRAVTRCTSSLPGHAEAVLHTAFSPDGRHLASGSGDTTVRLWDVSTETPRFTCRGHNHWVLVVVWSPDAQVLASACKNGHIILWDPNTGKQIGRPLRGHKQWVTALCWQPQHLVGTSSSRRLLASSSKDGDIRLWNASAGICDKVLTGHLKSVTALRWGGKDLLYSASQDRTIKVWNASSGALCRTLQGHGHWVNTLALNTDYALRTGAFEPQKLMKASPELTPSEEMREVAQSRYDAALAASGGVERLVSGSDDFTLFLWLPESDKKPLERMTGHQQLVNDVRFSPDTRLVASASFDKSIRLWSGSTGKFLAVLRGHVQAVYVLSWSADSRLLVSGSKDSTLKVWNIASRKIELDLPGHADEVFAVDWSPDGERVVSGGRDKILKVWRR